jgi:cell division protein FtsB
LERAVSDSPEQQRAKNSFFVSGAALRIGNRKRKTAMKPSSSRRHLVFLLLTISCLLFILGYTGRLAEQARLQLVLAGWQARIAEAEARQADLAAQLEYVRSDAYVHQQAREALNLVQPGDELVLLVERTPVAIAPEQTAPIDQRPMQAAPPWQQWLELFVPAIGNSVRH